MATGMSRRKADEAIAHGRVAVNGILASLGDITEKSDVISLDGKKLTNLNNSIIVVLNKPTGVVCSRNGQGNKSIYDIMPEKFKKLKTIGRLDKDSSGLILLTNDGELANKLTHPSYQKEKVYRVTLNKKLLEDDKLQIQKGVKLTDGLSKLGLEGHELEWIVRMNEGRNRQIRRTFSTLGYNVEKLHRIQFGPYLLKNLKVGEYEEVNR